MFLYSPFSPLSRWVPLFSACPNDVWGISVSLWSLLMTAVLTFLLTTGNAWNITESEYRNLQARFSNTCNMHDWLMGLFLRMCIKQCLCSPTCNDTYTFIALQRGLYGRSAYLNTAWHMYSIGTLTSPSNMYGTHVCFVPLCSGCSPKKAQSPGRRRDPYKVLERWWVFQLQLLLNIHTIHIS